MRGGAGDIQDTNMKYKLIKNLIEHFTSTAPVASHELETNCKNLHTTLTAKLDSGATKYFLTENDGKKLANIKNLLNGPTASLPNNALVKATKIGIIPLNDKLSKKACEALIFPNITNASLLSVGQLCDDNCLARFSKTRFFVLKNNKIIHQGLQNKTDGLWDFTLHTQSTQHNINYTITIR